MEPTSINAIPKATMISAKRYLKKELIQKLLGLKYEHRAGIRDRAALEQNVRERFQPLGHVKLTNAEIFGEHWAWDIARAVRKPSWPVTTGGSL